MSARSETAAAIGTCAAFLVYGGSNQFKGKSSRHCQSCSKWYCPIILDRRVCCLRVLSERDFCFFRIRLVGEFRSLRVSDVTKNQARVLQFLQQFRVPLGKEFESPGPIGLHPGDFQNHCG